jgi:large subunit ribosomal protein L4
MGMDDVLIITDNLDENLQLSSRNLPHVMIVDVGHADPVSLIRHGKVLMTKGAVSKIEELLA